MDFDGNRYRAASAHQKEWGARLIDELELTGNEHILDIGCGDGVLTAGLAEADPQGSVIGIDSSAGTIEAARCSRGARVTQDRVPVVVCLPWR